METSKELVAAWFAGTGEGNPDVGIWLSRRGPDGWSPPVEVADGRQPDGTRHPCWNPVLFQPKKGPLVLFFGEVDGVPEVFVNGAKAATTPTEVQTSVIR